MQYKSEDIGQRIPLCIPEIRGNEWDYVKSCLDSGWVSSVGSSVDRFEQVVAEYVGREYAVATVNGTSALHISLLINGVGQGDEVLVPTLTFIATVNAISYTGAVPVFIDSEPDYWQMDPGKVEQFLKEECHLSGGLLKNKTTGRNVKAILPVDLLGHPCDMDSIVNLGSTFGLSVIEDAAESLGARYKSKKVGSQGDVACLSFNGNKIITTGGGGMILTDNEQFASQAKYLTTQAKDHPVEYIHNAIGFNYRLTNLQAAMGVAQMECLDEFVAKKRQIADVYETAFKKLDYLTTMPTQASMEPTYWLYTVLLPDGTSVADRTDIITRLGALGIETRPLWHMIHGLPPYQECQSFKIRHAVNLYERAISLPSSVGLTINDQQKCIDSFIQICTDVIG